MSTPLFLTDVFWVRSITILESQLDERIHYSLQSQQLHYLLLLLTQTCSNRSFTFYKGTACLIIFDPIKALLASSFSKNGIREAATDTNCCGFTSMKSISDGSQNKITSFATYLLFCKFSIFINWAICLSNGIILLHQHLNIRLHL